MYTIISLYSRKMYKYVLFIILYIILNLQTYNVLLLRQKENICHLVLIFLKNLYLLTKKIKCSINWDNYKIN